MTVSNIWVYYNIMLSTMKILKCRKSFERLQWWTVKVVYCLHGSSVKLHIKHTDAMNWFTYKGTRELQEFPNQEYTINHEMSYIWNRRICSEVYAPEFECKYLSKNMLINILRRITHYSVHSEYLNLLHYSCSTYETRVSRIFKQTVQNFWVKLIKKCLVVNYLRNEVLVLVLLRKDITCCTSSILIL